MGQRFDDGGNPLRRIASDSAIYVFDGKVACLRQFDTAFGVDPVISATARLPPNASMTSRVVERLMRRL